MCSREMPSSPGQKWDHASPDRASLPYTGNSPAELQKLFDAFGMCKRNKLNEEVKYAGKRNDRTRS